MQSYAAALLARLPLADVQAVGVGYRSLFLRRPLCIKIGFIESRLFEGRYSAAAAADEGLIALAGERAIAIASGLALMVAR